MGDSPFDPPGFAPRSAPDPFAESVECCRLRLTADPHL